ncbi:hypothetical protein AAFF_G00051740 [Aldrovandia affinis]|uniref:Uncharacterized protein n=1 Tax=Aldrovandia affinis TaxID=143900 RepID=A0AAD7T4H3_9TELE|nr:hypothetical protein AAFF_G00051740 [Aldrovandia affinis]
MERLSSVRSCELNSTPAIEAYLWVLWLAVKLQTHESGELPSPEWFQCDAQTGQLKVGIGAGSILPQTNILLSAAEHKRTNRTKVRYASEERRIIGRPSACKKASALISVFIAGPSLQVTPSSPSVGRSTVSGIVREVTQAIQDCLVHDSMPVPQVADWRKMAEDFQELWNLELLDGKHVIVQAPVMSGSQFYNKKGTFSLILLAVVDARHCVGQEE